MNILEKFGKRVRDKRLKMGISQEGLAFKAKLHRTYISDIERGNRNIALLSIEKVAKALNVPLKKLF